MRLWLGFALLCLLSGVGWIVDEAVPGVLTGLLQIAVHLGAIALICMVALLIRRCHRRGRWLRIAAWSAGMIAVPQVLLARSANHVPSLTSVLLFTLVPVVVVVAEAQRSDRFGANDNPLSRVAPALAGTVGAALLLPFNLPSDVAGRVWFAVLLASVVLSGLSAVKLHQELQGAPLLKSAAVYTGTTALIAAGFWRAGMVVPNALTKEAVLAETLRWALIDAPVVLLTVWLLRELRPVAASVRMLLIPLVAILASFGIARPGLNWTITAGCALMAGGSLMLLWSEPPATYPT